MRRTVLMILAMLVAGCQLIAPPGPDATGLPGLPAPSLAPPRLSPSIEIPPPL